MRSLCLLEKMEKKLLKIFLSVMRNKGKQVLADYKNVKRTMAHTSSKCPRNNIFLWMINDFMDKDSICYGGSVTKENSKKSNQRFIHYGGQRNPTGNRNHCSLLPRWRLKRAPSYQQKETWISSVRCLLTSLSKITCHDRNISLRFF